MTQQVLGIIGDGQLGMMLCDAARNLGVGTVMLAGDPEAPAALRADRVISGAMDDADAITKLIEHCDVITYEREDIPPATIGRLRDAEDAALVRCFPPLAVVELIQDKARQKRWLADNAIPTLPFVISDGSRAMRDNAADTLGYPLVQKALRGGFDGRGVQLLRDAQSLEKAWPGETLFERYAGDFTEVAVLLIRDRAGNCSHFGPVDMTFETDHSVLDTVCAPAQLPAELEREAVALATRAIEAMNGVGVFGVEMFVLAGPQLVINEISPRVHNAGHYTIEACASSQFEQHVRAVLGMPLADTTLNSPAAMRNLLCTPALNDEGRTHAAGVEAGAGSVTVHWYGKSPARLMRKLGHVTALAPSVELALERANLQWSMIQETAQANTQAAEESQL